MIEVENFKAFHGIMRITPRGMIVPTFELESDWLYNPDSDCWCNNDTEFDAEICTVVSDDSEKQTPMKPYYFSDGYADGFPVYDEARCPICECDFEEESTNWGCKYCPDCGQALDWSDV